MLQSAKQTITATHDSDDRSSQLTMPGPSLPAYYPEHAPALPECYDDQVAFLYSRIEELKQLFERFVEDHEEMKVFRDLRLPLGRLAVSPNVVRVTLDEFCKAVEYVLLRFLNYKQNLRCFIGRDLKFQITETFEQDPETQTSESLLLSISSHYVDEEPSNVHPRPIPMRIVNPSNTKQISDGTKPFEYKIQEKGCAKYPITIEWHPTAPMPGTDAIPAGLRFEVNSSSHIVVSDLPPVVDPPRTAVNEDVAQWRDGVPNASAATTMPWSKGKKRARSEIMEDYVESPQRSRRARVTIKNSELVQNNPNPDVPAPLRRSARLTAENKNRIAKAKGKIQATEESNSSARGSKSRARLRTAAKRA